MRWVTLQVTRSKKGGYYATLPAGRRKREETVDIKIRKRTKSIREIEIENMQETSEYMRLRTEGMRGIHQTRPNEKGSPNGSASRESIEAFLKEAFG